MTAEEEHYIRVLLSRSRESFAAAELLIENQFFHPAINRLYYACFYAVSALLVQFGVSAKTHTGVRTLFSDRVIRIGLLPNEYGDLYTKLFNLRHETDYAVLIEIDPAETRGRLPSVKRFIEAIEQLIEERIGE